MLNQPTLKEKANCTGIGLHSGQNIRLEVLPAPENTGIVFTRTDVGAQAEVAATVENVVDTRLATTLGSQIHDPTFTPRDGGFQRWASRFIRDERDAPFVRLMLIIAATVVPHGVALFLPGVFNPFSAVLHGALVLFFVGPYILMLHNTSHRRLFKTRYRWLDPVIPWVLGPFFGETPETYYAHHIGMHHPENNLQTDLSTTLPYRRDSFVHFLRYFGRFFFLGLVELGLYLRRNGRTKLMRRMLVGELSFYILMAVLLWIEWRATLVVFVGPFVFARFAMMAGNWGQHAFVDASDPNNPYLNSITCINTVYNRRCFNDGYHIGHHVKPNRHWTEMPKDFLNNRHQYMAHRALVFEGIDFFMVWLFLMLKRYDWLAKHHVTLSAEGPSPQEVIQTMRQRVQPLVG